MRGGLEPFAKSLSNLATGLNLTVRNVATHTRDELSEQEAMERLAAYSYLAGSSTGARSTESMRSGGRAAGRVAHRCSPEVVTLAVVQIVSALRSRPRMRHTAACGRSA